MFVVMYKWMLNLYFRVTSYVSYLPMPSYFCLHSQLFLVWNLVELLEGLPGEDFDWIAWRRFWLSVVHSVWQSYCGNKVYFSMFLWLFIPSSITCVHWALGMYTRQCGSEPWRSILISGLCGNTGICLPVDGRESRLNIWILSCDQH